MGEAIRRTAAALALGFALASVVAPVAARAQTDGTNPPKPSPSGQPASKTLVEDAVKVAAEQRKTVLVIFHASWSGGSKRLEAALTSPEVAPIMAVHFVTIH